MEKLLYLKSPYGALKVRFQKEKVVYIDWTKQSPQFRTQMDSVERQVADEILAYLEGRLKKLTFPYELTDGTPFQRQVWKAIQSIPYGQVATYGDLALKIGNPKAVRAVGGACGKNPILIRIPCHRVVAKSGLGGFSSPMELKKVLLDIEGFSAQ